MLPVQFMILYKHVNLNPNKTKLRLDVIVIYHTYIWEYVGVTNEYDKWSILIIVLLERNLFNSTRLLKLIYFHQNEDLQGMENPFLNYVQYNPMHMHHD